MSLESEKGSALPRLLGPWSAASILIGCIIGSGIFVKPAKIAASLPSPGWILAAWAIAGILALIGSLAFAEMSSMYPEAGGQYVYLRESFGRLPAFLFGWTNLTIINSATIAAIAFISVEYLVPLLESFPGIGPLGIAKDGTAYKLITVLLIAALTGANAVGVLWGAAVQNILTAIKLLALGAIIAGMLLPGRPHLANLDPFWAIRSPAEGEGILRGFKEAFLAIFWAYDGWYLLSFSGGEIRNPRRNIPLGFVLGILAVISVYVLVNVSYLAAIPVSEMGKVDRLGGVAAEVAGKFFGAAGFLLIALGIFGSTLGASNGNILTGSRLIFAVARDGLLFRSLGDLHPRFLTPVRALLLQGVLSVLCVFLGNFDDLSDSVVFAAWIFYGLTILGLAILRRKNRGRELPFAMPGYPVLPALFAAFAACFVVYNVWDAAASVRGALESLGREGSAALKGLYPLFVTAVILLGLPVYAFFRKRRAAGG